MGALGRNEMQGDVPGILDRAVFNVAISERWKYINVGVAKLCRESKASIAAQSFVLL